MVIVMVSIVTIGVLPVGPVRVPLKLPLPPLNDGERLEGGAPDADDDSDAVTGDSSVDDEDGPTSPVPRATLDSLMVL